MDADKVKRLAKCVKVLGLQTPISAASAMTFEVSYSDNRPIFPATLWVNASGIIEQGDTQKLLELIVSHSGKEIQEITFRFDSAGGNLWEGMSLGKAISTLPYRTRSYVGLDDGLGICASACVNAYLGSTFRYLESQSRIGVHRFYMEGNPLNPNEALSISQELSVKIISHLREMRADPRFFDIMVSARAEEIFWVPHETLRNLNVVTNSQFEETAKYKNINGTLGLYLRQVGQYGAYALTLICGGEPFASGAVSN